ncbi:MAG: hypothetical protein R6V41_03325 [Desulfobacteraceae bacterium]
MVRKTLDETRKVPEQTRNLFLDPFFDKKSNLSVPGKGAEKQAWMSGRSLLDKDTVIPYTEFSAEI